MERRGGIRLSELLNNSNEFGDRLLAAYGIAGTACVDRLPQRAFMFFAVALESVVLGKGGDGEITFQLATRVAHLIGGDNLDDKRKVVEQAKRLYKMRSKIAHAGESQVSFADVLEIQNLCLTTLLAMTISPAFENMTRNSELEEWFSDRILDASRHLPAQISPIGLS